MEAALGRPGCNVTVILVSKLKVEPISLVDMKKNEWSSLILPCLKKLFENLEAWIRIDDDFDVFPFVLVFQRAGDE